MDTLNLVPRENEEEDSPTSVGNRESNNSSTRTLSYTINPVGEMIHEKLQQEFPGLLL